MIPGQFDYVRPAGLHDALRILSEREGEAKILSGGYSLLPLLKLRLAQPGLLVDIRDIDGLDVIVETDDALRIGARATHRQILEDPTVRAGYPILVDAASGIGDPQVRNWGTIGGSCAHADPSADWPAVLLATRATLVCRSSAGRATRASPWIGGQNGSASDDGWRSISTATQRRAAAASIASRNGPIASMS